MSRRSVYRKFLAIQLPLFLVAVAIGLHALADARMRQAREHLAARVGAQAARVGALAADVGSAGDSAQANKLLSLLLADRAILCAEIEEAGRPAGSIAAPRRIGCRGETLDDTLSLALPGDVDRRLTLGLSHAEIDEQRLYWRDFSIGLALAAAIAAALAAALAFRHTIGKPLSALLAAIRETSRTGRPSATPQTSDDEIGELIDAFNAMQARLRSDRDKLAAARDAIGSIYDRTPALLFTMSLDGAVRAVSEFWLATTGHRRTDVVDQPLARLLEAESRVRLRNEILTALHERCTVRDAPLTLRRADGSTVDVLFSAVLDSADLSRRSAVCVMTDVSALRAAERRLRDQAMTDALTGLPNRAALAERLAQLAATARPGATTAMMLVDLDDFKQVNDTQGHAAGDDLLIEAGRCIRLCLRRTDFVARLGGDEFAVICPDVDEAWAQEKARAIVARLGRGVAFAGTAARVGASVGVAMTAADAIRPDELLRRADLAMYQAKRDGKAGFSTAPSSDDRRAA